MIYEFLRKEINLGGWLSQYEFIAKQPLTQWRDRPYPGRCCQKVGGVIWTGIHAVVLWKNKKLVIVNAAIVYYSVYKAYRQKMAVCLV